MVVIDAETRSIVSKKARLYDIKKDQIKRKIEENIEIAISKLKTTEQELLDEVEVEFSENPFLVFLENDEHTDIEIRNILSKEIPESFGPSEESFCSLLKEIESFKSWKKSKESPLELIPQNLKYTDVTHNTISLSWDEVESARFYDVELRSLSTKNIYHSTKPHYTFSGLKPSTEYDFCVRVVTTQNSKSMWSDPVTIQTKEQPFIWKRCPEYVDTMRKYSVDESNPRIAIKIGSDGNYCTIINNTILPSNKVILWNIKILKSKDNNGANIRIGVAPFDIDQNEDNNYTNCGWYFSCYNSTLYSGSPHNYRGKEYGPRKEDGEYVHTGDTIGVVVDTTAKDELSFVLNGVNLGVAYEGIPLDKPLVPCVILFHKGNSVKFVI